MFNLKLLHRQQTMYISHCTLNTVHCLEERGREPAIGSTLFWARIRCIYIVNIFFRKYIIIGRRRSMGDGTYFLRSTLDSWQFYSALRPTSPTLSVLGYRESRQSKKIKELSCGKYLIPLYNFYKSGYRI